jgi:hypothetical protein
MGKTVLLATRLRFSAYEGETQRVFPGGQDLSGSENM